MFTLAPSVPGKFSLSWAQKSSLAASAGAAALPSAAALVSAALVAAAVELLLLLVELLLHADSTSATAPMPAMVAVILFVGLWVTRPTSVSSGCEGACEGAHTPLSMKTFSTVSRKSRTGFCA